MNLRALFFAAGLAAAGAAAQSPAPSPAANPPPAPAAAPEGIPLAEIAPQSQTAITLLKGLEADDAPDAETDAVRQALPELSATIGQLLVNGSKVTADAAALDALRDLQTNWHKIEASLVNRAEELGRRGRTLEAESAQVQKLEAAWKTTDKTVRARDASVPAEIVGLVRDVLEAARDARQRIKVRQTSVLELQTRVGEAIDRTRLALGAVQQATAGALKTLGVRESPPLWTAAAQPRADLAARWRPSFTRQFDELHAYTLGHGPLFAIHAAIFAVLLGLLVWLRRGLHRWTEEEPHLKRSAPIFELPIATALALSFVVKGPLYDGAPTLFWAIIGAVTLLPTIVILRRLLAPRLYTVLYSLVIFYGLDQVRIAASALPALNRWIFTVEIAGAIMVFLLLARAQRSAPAGARGSLGRWLPPLIALAIAALAAALGASLLGYVRLGALVGEGVLRSSYVAVFLYALLRVIEGLTLIALRVPPVTALRIAREHRDLVQNKIYRAFRAGAVLVWLYLTLYFLQLLDPLWAWGARTLTAPHTLGSFSLTLGQAVNFALAIWVSLTVSRVLRFFLNEEVYERVNLSPGLPYAISTILNYLVLLVGFLIALGLLGVDLRNISIVAGAFSVGLGFGLQNIINNFVSGIILLFERPVKVGDVIQIGEAVGEVRRIGIRASIVRIRDGSDLILPNGNLISNQVVNWTYGDRRRAVEIALTIAPGPDPGHVLDLLKAAAAGESEGDGRPPPQAYLTGITATGLGLVVRVWVNHYEDWIKVRSDLSLKLAAALSREEIKLI